jgi:hypothetical protein
MSLFGNTMPMRRLGFSEASIGLSECNGRYCRTGNGGKK